MRTGFSPVEIFRKYMWYLLRERQFDQEAVTDMVHLKQALGLKNEQAILFFPITHLTVVPGCDTGSWQDMFLLHAHSGFEHLVKLG